MISHFADYGSCSRAIAKGSINCQLVVQLLAVFEFEIHAKGVRNRFNLGLVSIARDVSSNTKTTCGDGICLTDHTNGGVAISIDELIGMR